MSSAAGCRVRANPTHSATMVTEEDVYLLAQSDARIDKERSMRRKRLRRYDHVDVLLAPTTAGCTVLARPARPRCHRCVGLANHLDIGDQPRGNPNRNRRTYPTVLSPALQALARHRKQPGGLSVDAIKLSHHGSKGNVTTELLKSVRADHYIVSTNGAIFKHPDDEAIARVVLNGGRRHNLWFNYRNERSLRWADDSRLAEHGCRVVLPDAGHEGFTLPLGTRSLPSTSGPTRGGAQDASASA